MAKEGSGQVSRSPEGDIGQAVRSLFAAESRRVLATLIRVLGDFDLAEEAMQEAFAAAVEQWPRDGIPENPRAWLVTTGRFKAVDVIRRRARFDSSLATIADRLPTRPTTALDEPPSVADDQLRLIFMCCHPAIGPEAGIALTLREVCGLTTEAIGHAFLTPATTIAQRIVRAKAKIRDERIPYQVPEQDELPARLESVLRVIYLVFSEGYAASSGSELVHADLSDEAIRLGRLLVELLPEPEAMGLLALMLLHESRRVARTGPGGDLVLLEDQDRSRWNRRQIAEGLSLVQRAFSSGRVGTYTLQAAIAGAHAQAPNAASTDWNRIATLYQLLIQVDPSPVVALNRAVAVAMRDGPEAGLALIDEIADSGELAGYHLLHAARADMLRRLGRTADARQDYQRAIDLVEQEPERRFLERRIRESR